MSQHVLGANAGLQSLEPLEPRAVAVTARGRIVAAAALTALVVGGIGWGVVETLHRDQAATAAPSGSLSAELSQRRAVQLAVSSFAANLTTYSVDDIGAYKTRLTPLMTPGFAQSFGLAVDGIVAEVKSTKMTSQGQVVQTAVSAVDATTATALVVADVQVGSSLGDRVRHFRWKVSLVLQGGSWLVDGFDPVA